MKEYTMKFQNRNVRHLVIRKLVVPVELLEADMCALVKQGTLEMESTAFVSKTEI